MPQIIAYIYVGARAKLDFDSWIGSQWGIQDFDKGGPTYKTFWQVFVGGRRGRPVGGGHAVADPGVCVTGMIPPP